MYYTLRVILVLQMFLTLSFSCCTIRTSMSLEFENSSTPFLENETEICPGIMSETKTLIHSRLELLMYLGEYIRFTIFYR